MLHRAVIVVLSRICINILTSTKAGQRSQRLQIKTISVQYLHKERDSKLVFSLFYFYFFFKREWFLIIKYILYDKIRQRRTQDGKNKNHISAIFTKS